MSKLFWAILSVFSIIITAWSGFFLYNEFQTKDMTSVPLVPVTQPAEVTPSAIEVASTTVPTPVEVTTSTPTLNQVEPTKVEKPHPQRVNGKEIVKFEFSSATAKKVALVGDFNKWYRQAMKREGDNWTLSIPLAPGKYEYVFVVDDGKSGANGKRVTDPKNEQKSKDGKLSLITIKKFENK